MKRIHLSCFVLVCILFQSISIYSQNRAIDSLENVLKTYQKQDTIRVNTLNYLAFYNYRNNPPQAIAYNDEALNLAKALNATKFIAHSYYIRAVVYTEQVNFEVAIKNYNKALEVYNSINDLNGLKKCNNGLGVLHQYRGNYDLALKHFKETLSISEQLGDNSNKHSYLYNIGNVYSETGEYQKALENFKLALENNIKNRDSLGMLNCYNSIANVYYQQSNYPLALNYHNQSLDIAQKSKDSIGIFQSLINLGNLYRFQGLNDKALSYYNKAHAIDNAKYNVKNITALKNNIAGIYYDNDELDKAITYFKESIVLSKEIDDKVNLATALNGLGFAYFQKKDYATALSYFDQALNINLKINQSYDMMDSYHGLADTYYRLKTYDLALENAQRLADSSEKHGLLRHKKNAYGLLSDIYGKTRNYKKAFESHQQYKILNDSIFNEDNIEKMTQLEYEYKYKQALDSASIRELKLTKTVQATSQDLQKSKRNYLWAIICVLLVSIILGSIIFSQRLKNEKSKTQNVVMEQKLLRSQMTPHFIFNSLSVLQGMILNKEEKKSIQYLSKFSKLLRITLENSRDKMVSLSQELLAIQNYLTLQNLENDTFNCTILVDEAIDVTLFEVPPMLIQPFVENAIEHAFKDQTDNKRIDIKLAYTNKKLLCTIADNGIGIDSVKKSENKNKSSLATVITAERLAVLSKDYNMEGSVTIEDRKKFDEQGTLVTLVIPHKIIAIS